MMSLKLLPTMIAATVLLAACDNGSTGAPPASQGAAGYWMPFGMASTSGAVAASSILGLVNSENIAHKQLLALPTSGDVLFPLLIESGVFVPSSNEYRDVAPDYLAFVQNGRWYESAPRRAESQTPFQISNETAAAICLAATHVSDRSARNTGVLLYSLPGADGECYSGDDVIKAIPLGAPASLAPVVLPISGIFSDAADFYDKAGKLAGVLQVVNHRQLVLLSGPVLATMTSLLSSADPSATVAILDADAGQALVRANGNVYHVDSSGLPGPSLHALASGAAIGATTSDGTTFFFTEDSVDIFSGSTNLSVYSLPVDGSSAATAIYTNGPLTDIGIGTALAATASKLFLATSQPFSKNAQTLYLLDKTRAAVGILPPSKLDSSTTGFIRFRALSGSKLFYNLEDSNNTSGAGTAKIVSDSGVIGSSFANSLWAGSVLRPATKQSDDRFVSNNDPVSVVLAQYSSPYDGSVSLGIYSLADLALHPAGVLHPAGNTYQAIRFVARNSVGLGIDTSALSGQNYFDDVFALDTARLVSDLTTNSPEQDENPVPSFY